MLQYRLCSCWLHCHCVNISAGVVDNSPFICPFCVKSTVYCISNLKTEISSLTFLLILPLVLMPFWSRPQHNFQYFTSSFSNFQFLSLYWYFPFRPEELQHCTHTQIISPFPAPSDYRPISPLSFARKTIERHIFNYMTFVDLIICSVWLLS